MKITLLGFATHVSSGQTGHYDIKAHAPDGDVRDVRVYLTCKHDQLFNIIPCASVPYIIPKLLQKNEVGENLCFAITALSAEPGKSYDCELHYHWRNCNDKDGEEHHRFETVSVPVHASDSAYFAIGIAKELQKKSESFYLEMVSNGKAAQDGQWALAGGADLDPARVAVSETSFNWAM